MKGIFNEIVFVLNFLFESVLITKERSGNFPGEDHQIGSHIFKRLSNPNNLYDISIQTNFHDLS